MFISNQARLKRYRKDRFIEEQNDAAQQTLLYSEIAIQHGEEEQAAALVKLAGRTFSKLTGDTEAFIDKPIVEKAGVPQLSGFDILRNAVKNGKLDELFKSVIKLPDSVLNATQKLIKKDLMNPEFKKTINETIADALARNPSPDEITEVIRGIVGGDENKKDVDDMLNKSRSGSEDSNASNAPTEASLLSQASTLASTLITEHATTGKQLDFGELEKLVTDLGTGEGAVTRLKGFLATIREDDKFKDLPKIKGNNFKSAEKDFKTIIKGSPLYIE